MIIPIGVTAKNEAKNLTVLLKSLRHSVDNATKQLNVQFEIHVLLNDNTDDSESLLAGQPDIHVSHTTGGLVEAQRFFKQLRPQAEFLIFSDADIILQENCIAEIAQQMIMNHHLEVAYAEKYPVKNKRRTLLARALYLYNLNNGYQDRRHYFNGQLFAIRNWNIPTKQQLNWKTELNNHFLNLEEGIRCDDIFISRDLLKRFGPKSIVCVDAAICYRAPETLQGMYRKYQRMRLEIERLNSYFPDSLETHNHLGRRRLQKKIIFSKPFTEMGFYALFLMCLYLCKVWYQAEKFYYGKVSKQPCPTWKPVLETKDLS